MKKIIFLFTLVLAIAMISGYKRSAQNEKAEKYAIPAPSKDFKGIKKTGVHESKSDRESLTSPKAPENRPKILHLLSNDTGQTDWSPALWWSYKHANAGQPGC